jgi:hypothetical protein
MRCITLTFGASDMSWQRLLYGQRIAFKTLSVDRFSILYDCIS